MYEDQSRPPAEVPGVTTRHLVVLALGGRGHLSYPHNIAGFHFWLAAGAETSDMQKTARRSEERMSAIASRCEHGAGAEGPARGPTVRVGGRQQEA